MKVIYKVPLGFILFFVFSMGLALLPKVLVSRISDNPKYGMLYLSHLYRLYKKIWNEYTSEEDSNKLIKIIVEGFEHILS